MAVNTISYFPNPAGTENKIVGVLHTAVTAAATLYTHPGAKHVRVKAFSINVGAEVGVGDVVTGVLKIGTGQYPCLLKGGGGGTYATVQLSSEDCGFEPTFIQSGDTITFTTTDSSGTAANIKSAVSVVLEDYTA